MMEGSMEDGISREAKSHYVPNREIFVKRSPRSPLSTHSPESDSIDLAIDGVVVDTSIEQLYNNVCEMQSSDQSPSRRSFLSYGEESRIDSELRFLAGGEYEVVEAKKEAIPEEGRGEEGIIGGEKGETVNEKPRNGKLPLRWKSSRKPTKERNSPSKKMVPTEAEYLGPYLLKQARFLMSSGDSPQKALEFAIRAMKLFERSTKGKPNLDFVLCLHVVAALYCRLSRHAEAVPVLERSIGVPELELGQNHALAKFAGWMQLGDTYASLGQIENSLPCYMSGLEIQKQVLGEKDMRLGETCRYIAEAHVQAMQFDQAEKLCQMALEVHRENSSPGSPEEAADRRLLGLIYDAKGDYEASLEQYVLASLAIAAHGHDADVAAIDCNIGDAYMSLSRYDEAISSYQKALNAFKSVRGENHPAAAHVYSCLAELYNKTGKFKESKNCCENALRVYLKPPPGSPTEEIAVGLAELSAIYESMDEIDHALKLIQKAIKLYGNATGKQSTIAGLEAQTGVLYYIMGRYNDSYNSFKSSITKFRAIGEKKSALVGIALNQLGLACVQLYRIDEAVDCFEEARCILEEECGPSHAGTLGVYSNLAATYDAVGRVGDAIEILEFVVGMREEELGTANPDVEDEKRRLADLLKEAGRVRNRKSTSLETLLDTDPNFIKNHEIKAM